MKAAFVFVAVLLVLAPLASAAPGKVENVRAVPGNQRVTLAWDPVQGAANYTIRVYGEPSSVVRDVHEGGAVVFLTNGRSYAFQVSALDAAGAEGPPSDPVAATPQLQNDLAYLAAGLIAVWVGLFGYAAFLSRKENQLDQKLERILQARYQGRSP